MNWISVKKELPPYSERVLVSAYRSYETGEVLCWIDIADRRFTNKDGECWMNDKDDLKGGWTVSHWMQLPKAATL